MRAKKILATVAVGMGLLLSVAAQAGVGTITFMGRVVAPTCTIDTGSVAAMAPVGGHVEHKEFTMELTGCAGEGTKVATRVQTAAGELSLHSETDTNEVQIAVYEAGSAAAVSGTGVPPAGYAVTYLAKNSVTSGKMQKAAIYTVAYQ